MKNILSESDGHSIKGIAQRSWSRVLRLEMSRIGIYIYLVEAIQSLNRTPRSIAMCSCLLFSFLPFAFRCSLLSIFLSFSLCAAASCDSWRCGGPNGRSHAPRLAQSSTQEPSPLTYDDSGRSPFSYRKGTFLKLPHQCANEWEAAPHGRATYLQERALYNPLREEKGEHRATPGNCGDECITVTWA